MKMLIPKQDRPVKVRLDVRLEESLLKRLDQYCQFKESDRDWVIGAVLTVLFKKDREFAAWCRTTAGETLASPVTLKARS